MMGKKVVYIVSDIEKALGFEWTAFHLASRLDLSFILIGKKDTPFITYLQQINVPYTEVTDEMYPSVFKKWIRIYFILKAQKPDVVHIHLWRAMVLGLTASWILRIKKRIFTRHYSTLHYFEYPSGRKWDLLFNWLATDIVAISENVKTILIRWDKAKKSKIHVIHHGFDLNYFQNVSQERIDLIRKKYALSGSGPVIGVISRYLKLKGVPYIIDAFKQIRLYYPDAHLVLANAIGDYSVVIKELLQEIPSSGYSEITFEADLAALYQTFSVFVHVPIDVHSEAFGQTYVEALAAEIPSVFTLSGVAPEFIRDGDNALVVDYKNPSAIFVSVKLLLDDERKRLTLKKNAMRSVTDKFEIETMIRKLMLLYGIRN